MYLSPLFDAVLPNPTDDHPLDDGRLAAVDPPNPGKAHKEGLLRGLAVLGVLGVLIGISFLSSIVHSADADAAGAADDIIRSAIDTR